MGATIDMCQDETKVRAIIHCDSPLVDTKEASVCHNPPDLYRK